LKYWSNKKKILLKGNAVIGRKFNLKKSTIRTVAGEQPDLRRKSSSDWLACSSGDIWRSCSLPNHLLNHYHVVFAKLQFADFYNDSLVT